MDAVAQVEELKAHVFEMYRVLEYDIRPRYPWCLVRVIPKVGHVADDSGKVLLHLPEKQNKPVYEGMVLRTYLPFYRRFKLEPLCELGPVLCAPGQEAAKTCVKEELIESLVSPGDHVLFQHHEGVPVSPLDGGKGDYRLINENALIAKLLYGKRGYSRTRLKRMVGTLLDEAQKLPDNLEGNLKAAELAEKFAASLMDVAYVYFFPESKTISGV